MHNNGENGPSGLPTSPTTDVDTYRSELGKLLDLVHPQVMVVENEES